MQVVTSTLQSIVEANELPGLKDLLQECYSRLALTCPEQSAASKESIVRWLIGNDLEGFTHFDSTELKIAQQQIAYRYRILQQRYLGTTPERAYRNLITRLSSLVLLRYKSPTELALNRDCQRVVIDILQKVLQELLIKDIYVQEQIVWIFECSEDAHLRNALLLASLEEYCSRSIRNRPLVFHQFLNYLLHI